MSRRKRLFKKKIIQVRSVNKDLQLLMPKKKPLKRASLLELIAEAQTKVGKGKL